MLYLIGTGLSDEKDISLRGIEVAKSSDFVFLEAYTSMLPNLDASNLEKLIGKKVEELSREQIESGNILIEKAKGDDVSLFVVGDPMVATTHIDLVQRARKNGIEVKIIHNASILTAVCECGLQAYKFGRSATIVAPNGSYKPSSFYDIIEENREHGLHTLLFLDLDIKSGKYMSINEALEILLSIENEKKKGLVTGETNVVALARVGSEDQKIVYGHVSKISKQDFGNPLHILIVPGKMHEMEEEALEYYEVS